MVKHFVITNHQSLAIGAEYEQVYSLKQTLKVLFIHALVSGCVHSVTQCPGPTSNVFSIICRVLVFELVALIFRFINVFPSSTVSCCSTARIWSNGTSCLFKRKKQQVVQGKKYENAEYCVLKLCSITIIEEVQMKKCNVCSDIGWKITITP